MNGADAGSAQRTWALNAIPLRNAVLCAECDVLSDSPHDTCMVCGSRSLFNISRVFGGTLPAERVSLVAQAAVEDPSRDVVLRFPGPLKVRRSTTAEALELSGPVLEENVADEVERGMLFGS